MGFLLGVKYVMIIVGRASPLVVLFIADEKSA
jgi:hypothetical protein